jgi:hypothetical protein
MSPPLPHSPIAKMGGPYYYNQGQTLPHPSQYSNITLGPTSQNIRCALPITDSRVMSAGRHDKVSDTVISTTN